jgi:hypothetical protein
MVMVSCGTQKKAASHSSGKTSPTVEEIPAWHTCLIQNARATILVGDTKLSANTTLQVVRDSMLVISVMPVAGMEMIRFEATPSLLVGINKLDGTYATSTYEELNRKVTPSIQWETLQQLCSAELPTGADKARLIYALGDKVIELNVVYPARKTNVPVRVSHLKTNRYQKIDISKWL